MIEFAALTKILDASAGTDNFTALDDAITSNPDILDFLFNPPDTTMLMYILEKDSDPAIQNRKYNTSFPLQMTRLEIWIFFTRHMIIASIKVCFIKCILNLLMVELKL